MGLWDDDDKSPRHDDFPIYVGALPSGKIARETVFRVSGGSLHIMEAMNPFIDKLKEEGFDAICNVRIAGGDVSVVYCNAVKF